MEEAMTAIAEEQAVPANQTQAPAAEGQEPNPSDVEIEELETEGSEEEGEEGDGVEPELEMTEIEWNGKKHRIPAELKDGFLMQSDYTRKTQEVAELRKTYESKMEDAVKHYQTSQEVLEAKAYMLNVDTQLKQYENINWQQVANEDPMGAQQAYMHFQQLKEERGKVASYLDQENQQRTARAEQDIANRLQETRQFAEKNIPGWTPEVDVKVVDFATKELGFEVEQLRAAVNPNIYRALHLAWLGAQSLQKQNVAPKPSAPQAKPLTTVSAKSNPATRISPAQMSVEQMAAYLNKR